MKNFQKFQSFFLNVFIREDIAVSTQPLTVLKTPHYVHTFVNQGDPGPITLRARRSTIFKYIYPPQTPPPTPPFSSPHSYMVVLWEVSSDMGAGC